MRNEISVASRRLKLSVVIACYRDALAVPLVHERLCAVFEALEVEGEIVFVNDGSPDNAAEVLSGLASEDPRVVVVNHSRNFGSQNAFTSGMRISTGDAVALMDGDLQDPPELIEQFFRRWREGYDVVYGTRRTRDAPLHMRFLYRAFYRLFRTASYVSVPLDAGDFSLLDRRVVDVLNALPERNRFLRGLRAWVGFRQIGVPYARPGRRFGRSTNSLLRNVAWARQAIFSFSYAPLELITWLGVATVAVSLIAIVGQVMVRLVLPSSTPTGLTTLIALTLFLGGVQLLCLSIIGSYIAHIYDEVKRRPPYIVDTVLNPPATRADE
jgi:glycosyltransferase involved in cell wall biosynthesis